MILVFEFSYIIRGNVNLLLYHKIFLCVSLSIQGWNENGSVVGTVLGPRKRV